MTLFSADAELKRQLRSSPSNTLLLIPDDAFLSLIRITHLSGSGCGRFYGDEFRVRIARLVPNGSVGANHNLAAFGPRHMVVHKKAIMCRTKR
jgi:hypothetical protein